MACWQSWKPAPTEASFETWNACSKTSPPCRVGPPCPPAPGNQTDSVHRTTSLLFAFPMTTRRGRPLCLLFWHGGHRGARAGVEACPYRTSLEIWNACSTTNSLRRGGPLCPPAQGNPSDFGRQIMLMVLVFPMATRSGRPLCLPATRNNSLFTTPLSL